MDAPPGWIAKHIADVRVTGEPWAGTGMQPAVCWPSNESIKAWMKRLGGYPTAKDFWSFIAWLKAGNCRGMMQAKKVKQPKDSKEKRKHDVHTWRADVARVLRSDAPWDHKCTGPVIVRATLLMKRAKDRGEGGRIPYTRFEWRDIDNCQKPFQDAMTEAGVIEDDGLIFDTHVTQWIAASNEEPGLELSWWELMEKKQPNLFDADPMEERRRRV